MLRIMRKAVAIMAIMFSTLGVSSPRLVFASCTYMSTNVEQNLVGWPGWRVIHGNYGGAYANAKATSQAAGVNVTGCSGLNCPTSDWVWAAGSNQWASATLSSSFSIVQSGYTSGGQGGGLVTCRSAV